MTKARDLADNAEGTKTKAVDAKGDLIVGTANDTAARLAVGTDGHLLTAASGEATGLQWAAPAASIPANAVDVVAAIESTSSTSYTDLTTVGPTVTLTTGTRALIIITARRFSNGSTTSDNFIGVDISGATTIAPSDTRAMFLATTTTGASRPFVGMSFAYIETGLTAGSNTFTLKYRCSVGSILAQERILTVIDMGS